MQLRFRSQSRWQWVLRSEEKYQKKNPIMQLQSKSALFKDLMYSNFSTSFSILTQSAFWNEFVSG